MDWFTSGLGELVDWNDVGIISGGRSLSMKMMESSVVNSEATDVTIMVLCLVEDVSVDNSGASDNGFKDTGVPCVELSEDTDSVGLLLVTFRGSKENACSWVRASSVSASIERFVTVIGEKVSVLDVTSDGPGNVLDICIMSSVISNSISSCGIRDSSVKLTVVDKFDIDKNEFVNSSKDNVDTADTEGGDNVVVLIKGSDVDIDDDIGIVEVWNWEYSGSGGISEEIFGISVKSSEAKKMSVKGITSGVTVMALDVKKVGLDVEVVKVIGIISFFISNSISRSGIRDSADNNVDVVPSNDKVDFVVSDWEVAVVGSDVDIEDDIGIAEVWNGEYSGSGGILEELNVIVVESSGAIRMSVTGTISGEKAIALDVIKAGLDVESGKGIEISSSFISKPTSRSGIRDSFDKNEVVNSSKDKVDFFVTDDDVDIVAPIMETDVDKEDEVGVVEVWNWKYSGRGGISEELNVFSVEYSVARRMSVSGTISVDTTPDGLTLKLSVLEVKTDEIVDWIWLFSVWDFGVLNMFLLSFINSISIPSSGMRDSDVEVVIEEILDIKKVASFTFEVDLVVGDPAVSPEGEFDISTDASVGNVGSNDMDDSVVVNPRVPSRNIYDVCKVDNVTLTGGL